MPCFCAHKDIFGKPNEGAHQYKVLGTAVVDFAGTMGLAYLSQRVILRQRGGTFMQHLIFWLVFGEILHWLFCVDTAWIRALKFIYNYIS